MLSIWRAGTQGTRFKIQDLSNNIQIAQSSLGGNPSNWFITIDGQVTNPSASKYYDKVEIHMDGPNISNVGWGPEDVANSDGGPFGLYGRDGGITAPTGNYQLRAKVYNGTSVLVNLTVNFSIVSCNPPSPPSLSASPVSISQGNSSTLTATGCNGGTITWSHGLGTGSSKSVNPSATTTYTATCSTGGCTSSAASVTVTVDPPSNPISITFSAWRAGASGVRSKIMDLTENASIPLSSFNGSQANWFIAINNGQVTNPSGTNYYDRVEFRLDRPGATNEGWNENVANSDGGPFGLHGRDFDANPAGGSHQLRGFIGVEVLWLPRLRSISA
ncbi:hypothetical protein GCM10023091_11520 [Ravibacter arvi]|uniref:Ig-like domain-containing protein n=1 Tax=Ravibacter arvi TaxID=2051041 RepID=A0ABP8LST7_9BACT